MLILQRFIGESIRVGDITVKVCDVTSQNGKIKVKLGIEAPRSVPVHREEVYQKVKADETKVPQ